MCRGRIEFEQIVVIDRAPFLFSEIQFPHGDLFFAQPLPEIPVVRFEGHRVSVREEGGREIRRDEIDQAGEGFAPFAFLSGKAVISVEKHGGQQPEPEVCGRGGLQGKLCGF